VSVRALIQASATPTTVARRVPPVEMTSVFRIDFSIESETRKGKFSSVQ
jgi:hypothetical protein